MPVTRIPLPRAKRDVKRERCAQQSCSEACLNINRLRTAAAGRTTASLVRTALQRSASLRVGGVGLLDCLKGQGPPEEATRQRGGSPAQVRTDPGSVATNPDGSWFSALPRTPRRTCWPALDHGAPFRPTARGGRPSREWRRLRTRRRTLDAHGSAPSSIGGT